MIDTAKFKCELARLSVLYIQQLYWGVDCDRQITLKKIYVLYNIIKLIENINDCSVNSRLWDSFQVLNNKLNDSTILPFCETC